MGLFDLIKEHIKFGREYPFGTTFWLVFTFAPVVYLGLLLIANFYGISVRVAWLKPVTWLFLGTALLCCLSPVFLPWLLTSKSSVPTIGIARFETEHLTAPDINRVRDSVRRSLVGRSNENAPLVVQDVFESVSTKAAAVWAARRRKLSGLVWISVRSEKRGLSFDSNFTMLSPSGPSTEINSFRLEKPEVQATKGFEALGADVADLLYGVLGKNYAGEGDFNRAAEYLEAVVRPSTEVEAMYALSLCNRTDKDLNRALEVYSRIRSSLSRTLRQRLENDLVRFSQQERLALAQLTVHPGLSVEDRVKRLFALSNLGLYSAVLDEGTDLLREPTLTPDTRTRIDTVVALNEKRVRKVQSISVQRMLLGSSHSSTLFLIGNNLVHEFEFTDEDANRDVVFRLRGSVAPDGSWTIDGLLADSEGVRLATVQGSVINVDPTNIGEVRPDGGRRILYDRFGVILLLDVSDVPEPGILNDYASLGGTTRPESVRRLVKLTGLFFDRYGRLVAEFSPYSLALFTRGTGNCWLGRMGAGGKPAIWYMNRQIP